MSSDDKEVAENYRQQRQAASARLTGFKPMTPEEQIRWIDENREKILVLIRGSEPPRSDDEEHLEAYRQAIQNASKGSEFDDVNARASLDRVIGEIEQACWKNGIPTHAGVVHGTDAGLGLGIGQRGVMQTEASIIEVSVYFLSFVNQISRLLARTIPYRLIENEKVFISRNIVELRNVLARDGNLARDWSEALASFAAVGVQPQSPTVPLNSAQNTIRGLALRAIELFAIGHEYGHHSMRHGLASSSEDVTADAFEDEFGADLFGRRCSMIICSQGEENLYAVSGAGAVLILGALDLIRRVRSVLETGRNDPPPRSHHPPYPDRVANLAKADADLDEGLRQKAANDRQFSLDALEAVWERIMPIIVEYHQSGIRPKDDLDQTGWLPSR